MRLVEPLVLGGTTAPSRVVFGPHETNLGDGRALSERHVAYYERRAAGGAGVIVVEEASVHGSDWPYERCPLASECGDGWRSVAEACHLHGSLVIAALGHAGGQGSSAYSQAPLWAPSRVPEVNTREVPKSMEAADIAAVVRGFADAAALAVSSGCDGVEINAGQFSLIRQFLSGLTNQRGDEWADRSRLAREVLEAVRASIGDAVLGLRLSCDELAPWAGIVPEAGAELAAELGGLVDYITVVRGAIFSAAATRPDGHVGAGFNLDLVAMVREAVAAAHGDRVAVIAQGSIVEVSMAEAALVEGRCDGVEMTRAQIADADLVAKLRADAAERIRPCILCNQTCMVRDARNPIITCVVDPRSGHELTDPAEPTGRTDVAPDPSRRLTVVGSGPAGLEAARVAALGGWSVRVLERSDRVGGMTSVAARGHGRERFSTFVDWLAAECARSGVTIELCTEVSAADMADPHAPVVVATGSTRRPFEYTVGRGAIVVTAADLLGSLNPQDDLSAELVVVWDPIGGPIAVSVAEALAPLGATVTVATPDNIVGNELSRSGDLAPANARLQQAGVALARRCLLRSVDKGSAELEDRFTGERRRIEATLVVDCGHRLPEEELFHELQQVEAPAVLARAGDCVAPRTLLEAVREARGAVAALSGSGVLSDGVPMGRRGHH